MKFTYTNLREIGNNAYSSLKGSYATLSDRISANPLRIVPYLGLAAILAVGSGCAGRGTVREHGETLISHGTKIETLENLYKENTRRIQTQEDSTKVNGPICIFLGTGYDALVGALKQEMTRQFVNPSSKATAEEADTTCLLPTGKTDRYIGELWKDEDRNKKIEPWKEIDSIFFDVVGGVEYQGFPIEKKIIPLEVRMKMLNLRNIPSK